MTKRLYLLAGEASGDNLGASLMRGLRALEPDVEIFGVGGPAMETEGLNSLFPMDELSVMGIAEVLPKYPALRRRLHQTAEDVLTKQPDALITIDSPDFSLRLAKLVKARSDIRVVHYVAPSVWAWRPKRAERMAAHVDQVLALLPFEPPYMEAAGMRCDFVGHPVVTETWAGPDDVAEFRAAHGLGDAPVLLVLPGSRRSEVSRLMDVFGAAISQVAGDVPDLRVVLPAAPGLVDMLRDMSAGWTVSPIIVEGADKRAAFATADAALAASGTVSLELAANGVPMVIAYRMSWLSWQIMSRMALVDSVTLVNLVSDTREVPEFLGPDCVPERIAPEVVRLLTDDSAGAAQRRAMEETMRQLSRGEEAPGLRAARAVLDGLTRQ